MLRQLLNSTSTKVSSSRIGQGFSGRFFSSASTFHHLHEIKDCLNILDKSRSGWQKLNEIVLKVDGEELCGNYQRYMSDGDFLKVSKVALKHRIPIGDGHINDIQLSFQREVSRLGREAYVEVERDLLTQGVLLRG